MFVSQQLLEELIKYHSELATEVLQKIYSFGKCNEISCYSLCTGLYWIQGENICSMEWCSGGKYTSLKIKCTGEKHLKELSTI